MRHTLDELSYYFETRWHRLQPQDGAARGADSRPDRRDLPALSGNFMHTSCADALLLGERTRRCTSPCRETDDPTSLRALLDFYRQGLYHGCWGRRTARCSCCARTAVAAVRARKKPEVLERERDPHRFRASATENQRHAVPHHATITWTGPVHGKDFVIHRFRREPARPLSERRMKRSPLRDVAG